MDTSLFFISKALKENVRKDVRQIRGSITRAQQSEKECENTAPCAVPRRICKIPVKEVRSCVELVQTENVPEDGSAVVLRIDDFLQKIAFCYPDGRNGVTKELKFSFKSLTDSGSES
jgi:hypothetical protein